MHSLTKRVSFTFFCGVTLVLAWSRFPILIPWHTYTSHAVKAAPDTAVRPRLRLDLDPPMAAYGVDTANNLYPTQIIGLPGGKRAMYLRAANYPNSELAVLAPTATEVEKEPFFAEQLYLPLVTR